MVDLLRVRARLHIFPMGVDGHLSGPPQDIGSLHRSKIPDINPNVHGIPAAAPTVMDMAEQLDCPVARLRPGDHRIMEENEVGILVRNDDDLMLADPRQRTHPIIVVAT